MAPQTKSFVILGLIAILGSFAVVLYSTSHFTVYGPAGSGYQVIDYAHNQTASASAAGNQLSTVSTEGWKEYNNPDLGIKFLYAPTWKVLAPTQKYGFTVFQIDPGKKYYNFTVYVSPNEFAGVNGFKAQPEIISGRQGMNIQNLIYAVKGNSYYYTFELGVSQSLKPMFKTMVDSVTITK